MTAAAEHVHEVDKRNRALQAGWCRCGATFDERKQRWGEPKYTEGILRDAAWAEKQRLEAAGRG